MIAVANMWRTDRSQLISLAGAGVALGAILLNLGFFFRPGFDDVLGGLVHHAFVLGLMLILTAGSRTVSLLTLASFWLLGVWGVFGLAYLLESQLASLFGAEVDGEFVPVWLSPLVEEPLKLAPAAIFLLLAARGGRHPSMSDGLLLGFMVGAGVAFQEDAHVGEILLSGDGWGAGKPWTLIFPTISPLDARDNYFALNQALWAALSGLTIGAAVMLRHWRWAWPIALIGPLLSFTNHLMANQYTTTESGTSFLLRRVSGADVPWFYQTVRDLTLGGKLPMLVLIAGSVAIVVVELLIVRWVGKRDRMFPPLPLDRIFGLIAHATSNAGAFQLLAADRYLRLRRSVYFAAWRTRRAGRYPNVSDADLAQLVSMAARLEILPSQPSAAPPAEVPAGAFAPAAVPVPDAPAAGVPPAG